MHYARANLQRALQRFLLGRVATGALGVLFFVLVVRQLQREEFGAYTAMLALQAGVAVLATLGIEATLERFLPELRTQQDERSLSKLILLGVLVRAAVLMLVGLAAVLSMDSWVPLLSMQAYLATVPLALLWLVLFGLLSTCGAIHEALLNQGSAQLAQTVYSIVKTVLFVALPSALAGPDGLHRVMLCEAIATSIGLVISLGLLRRDVAAGFAVLRGPWVALPEALGLRMLRFGVKNYAAQLLMLLYGADAMRLVASSQAGLAQTGRFGAVHSLYEYIQRYLPAFMLMRLIRPVFVARYTATQDFSALNAMASLVLKINLLVLTPLLVFLAGAGDLLLDVASKGRYEDAGGLLVAYVALLVPMSNQWVISIVANTTEQNGTQVRAALFGVPGILIGTWLTSSHGLYALVAGAWCSYLTYNLVAMVLLRRAGLPYRLDVGSLVVCGIAAAVGCAAFGLLVSYLPMDSAGRFLWSAATALFSLLIMIILGLFNRDERVMLKKIVRRRNQLE